MTRSARAAVAEAAPGKAVRSGAGVGPIDAVDQEAVLRTGGAVDHEAAAASFEVGAGNLGQDGEQAPAFRDEADGIRGYRGRGRVRLGVDQRGFARDLNRLAHAPDLHGHIDLYLLTQGHHRGGLRRGEALERGRELIRPGRQGGETEDTFSIGHGGEPANVASAPRLNLRAGQNAALRVSHNPLDGSASAPAPGQEERRPVTKGKTMPPAIGS